MEERRQQLLTRINRAFAGVKLGDGVSLHELHVIDNYGTHEERRAARESDEMVDWRRLVDNPDLTVYFGIGYAGLCFLDAAGVLFHLPAGLFRSVRDFEQDDVGDMFESMYYLLTKPDVYNRRRLGILSSEQRACVHDCLLYFREMSESDEEELIQAIDYWTQSNGD